jgi:hypothetical protein
MFSHTTTSRASTLGRLCNTSKLYYLKNATARFAFYFAITHKVSYFWYVSSLLSHCHGSLKVSEMDPREYDFLSQNNLINVATKFDELQKPSLSVLYVIPRKPRTKVTSPQLPTQ